MVREESSGVDPTALEQDRPHLEPGREEEWKIISSRVVLESPKG